MTNRVFVYGTLKRGFSNHHFLQSSKYIGTGHTKELFSLYAEVIPYAFKYENFSHIYGELYEVDDYALAELDGLEGHPRWYRREEVVIVTDDPATPEVTAWLYFYPEKSGQLIRSGIYGE